MRQSLQLRQQMRDAINSELAERVQAHQARISRLKAARASLPAGRAAAVEAAPQQLVMLAHGDSWFDYPLSGNDLSLRSTDVIAQLESFGPVNPLILNLSHHGDATTDEMSLPKQERLIQALGDPTNWINGKPDAILFSGGGNDIAGDQFCIFLDWAGQGPTGLDAQRFTKTLGMVEASFLDLFYFRNRYAPDVPIFAHCYDFAIPNGVHPACAGPWLKPSLDYAGFNVTDGTAIVMTALQLFKAMLDRLANDPANNFVLVPTQGTLVATDWANELHPFPDGFKKIAGVLATSLAARFPGRISGPAAAMPQPQDAALSK